MVTKSKLKMALAAQKGTDFKKLNLKKKQKEAEKRNRAAGRGAPEEESSADEEDVAEDDDDDDEDDEEESKYDLEGIDDSDDSDSSIELEEKILRKSKKNIAPAAVKVVQKKAQAEEDDDEDDDEEEDDEDIPMSDLEDLDDADKEDLIPHQRLTINNTTALLAALNRIAVPTDKSTPFATHQTVSSAAETSESIPDVSDDLARELAFYSQSLDAARQARKLLRAEGVPFARPKDYFAEMVKEDAHMERVKAKLVDEASNKKAAAEARKMRDLKKFGKQVQVAKLQERQKSKRETLEKIKTLKRKRQESGGAGLDTKEADIFDVGVESEMKKHGQRSGSGRGQMGSGAGGNNNKRTKKNEKYGFGGKKRHAKSGDAASSGDLSGFNAKKMKAGAGKVTKSRPGKARRKSMGSR
ncbi:hypothetical protein FZEAL_8078 [Fusarium zealandicum]|uniref:rRNA processing protein EBP2 n=1 Tax=Fusarium zealandicum TaxID=1053134 RepID=A0A8H4UF75_9HYPO|nr:hypothetical protein FZEAL_8078 [Fusarium zealandicum]